MTKEEQAALTAKLLDLNKAGLLLYATLLSYHEEAAAQAIARFMIIIVNGTAEHRNEINESLRKIEEKLATNIEPDWPDTVV